MSATGSHQHGAIAASGAVGITNKRNTCFIASSVQTLAHGGPLVGRFLDGSYVQHLNDGNPQAGDLVVEYARCIQQLREGGNRPLDLTALRKQVCECSAASLQLTALSSGRRRDAHLAARCRVQMKKHKSLRPLMDGEQQDAHEFFVRLREVLVSGLDAEYSALLVGHYEFLEQSKLTCPECGNTSIQINPASELPLELPGGQVSSLSCC